MEKLHGLKQLVQLFIAVRKVRTIEGVGSDE